eukprot:356191-Chlamydomonas_euryale.AAC.3
MNGWVNSWGRMGWVYIWMAGFSFPRYKDGSRARRVGRLAERRMQLAFMHNNGVMSCLFALASTINTPEMGPLPGTSALQLKS